MKSLQLVPFIYKNQEVVKVDFAFDKTMIALVKAQKGVRWSQTLCSWYFPKKEFRLNAFLSILPFAVWGQSGQKHHFDTVP